MSSFTFYTYNKGAKVLFPKDAMRTEEYLAEHERLFMTDHLAKDDRGKNYFRYRLKSCEPMRFTDTLEYDIKCPRCHGDLRLCGMPLDSMTHGLYKCRRCDKEIERRF